MPIHRLTVPSPNCRRPDITVRTRPSHSGLGARLTVVTPH